MAYIIGLDEAGYGPNLGPLVIAATVWQVADGLDADDLYEALAPHVVPADTRSTAVREEAPLVVGDSKQLYHSGGSLELLERGVVGAIQALGKHCRTWQQLWEELAHDTAPAWQSEPWTVGFDMPIPLHSDRASIEAAAARWRSAFERGAARLLAMRARAIFPAEWNQLLESHAGKGDVVTRATLRLAATCLRDLKPDRVCIHCDKLGGRNRYAPWLQAEFPERLIEIWCETRQRSVYRWGSERERLECRFVAKGESCLASALGSMVAKYLRELAMIPFNRFWRQHVSGLRPTAGYPVDARRFMRDIAEARTRLGIDTDLVWRNR